MSPGNSLKETAAPPQNQQTSSTPDDPYSMTEEILQQRSEKINAGRFKTQLFAGIMACVSAISFGTVLGWSSPAIRASVDATKSDVLDKTFQFSWAASLGPLGCALGVPISSYFHIKLGPKRTMTVVDPLLFIVWIVLGAFQTDTNVKMIMRFLCGFFAISQRVCSETLLTDTVHVYYLRQLSVTCRSCRNLGILITYVMGYSVTDQFFSFTNCAIVAAHFIMLLLCPESPVYLYDKNTKKAEKSLIWYRGQSNTYVEMRNIKKDSDSRKVDTYKYMIYSKVVVKAILIIVMVNMAQVFSCYYIFLYFNPAVVRSLANSGAEKLEDIVVGKEDDSITRNIDALILGLNMFVSCVISTWVHYRLIFGVKKPLIVSTSLVTIILAMITIYMYLFEAKNKFVYKNNNWIYQVLVNLLVVCHELGLSCCSDIMLMDYIPNQVFPRAKSIVKVSQWFIIFLMTKNFFYISNNIHGSGTFAIFTGLCLGLCVAICILVVESKGKTLVEVQMEIGGNPIGSRGVYNKRLANVKEALLTF